MKVKYRQNNVSLIYKGRTIRRVIGEVNNAQEINLNELPYIYTYCYEPIMDVNDNVVIPLYFTDFRQTEYYLDDPNRFIYKMRVQIDDNNPTYINNLKSGDYDLHLGRLPIGNHHFNVEVTDQYGRVSWRLFKEVRILNLKDHEITSAQTYTITDNDLARHRVNKNNSTNVEDMKNNRMGLTSLLAEVRNNGYRKCILPTGIYRVNRCLRKGKGENTPIALPSGLTVDMNGATFKLHPYDDREYGDKAQVENLMVRIEDCEDTHLINGTLEGDFAERKTMIWSDGTNAIQGSNGEGNNTVAMYGGKYNSLENVTITQTTGYNFGASFGSGIIKSASAPIDNKDVDIEGNLIDTDEKKCTIDYFDLTPFIEGSDRYLSVSVWLAYGMPKGQEWDYKYSFYDKDKNFIESFNVQQFRTCRAPLGAKFARLTFKCTASEVGSFSVHSQPSPKYCSLKNIEAIDNRTCMAPAQFHHLIMENINFTRSGQSITPCPIDLEDGWEQMQDFYLRNVNVIENVGTAGVIINAGLNMVIENCTNLDMIMRYRIHGLTVRNNTNCGFRNSFGWMSKHSIRVYDNVFKDTGLDGTDHPLDQPIIIKNNHILNGWVGSHNNRDMGYKYYEYRGCVIENCSTNPYGVYKNCIIKNTNSNAKYQGGGKWYNCDFHTQTDNEQYGFSLNSGEDTGIYIYDSVFHCPLLFREHNIFEKAEMKNCLLKKEVIIRRLSNGKDGYCEIRDCTFEGKLKIETIRRLNLRFYNCTFKQGIEVVKNHEGQIYIDDELFYGAE